jgi:hypothetical protein
VATRATTLPQIAARSTCSAVPARTGSRRAISRRRQEAYLKASNAGTGDYFGASVALSGDSLTVGAWFEASAAQGVGGNQTDDSAPRSGAVYIFH